jgi:hypothetical protein
MPSGGRGFWDQDRRIIIVSFGVRLCTGGQWITWIVGSVTNLWVEKNARRSQPCEDSSFQGSQDPNWSTGELGSSCVISVAQPTRSSARRTLVLDPQGAAGILPKSSDERKRGEAFPQTRLVSQAKQSHLTWLHRLASEPPEFPIESKNVGFSQCSKAR